MPHMELIFTEIWKSCPKCRSKILCDYYSAIFFCAQTNLRKIIFPNVFMRKIFSPSELYFTWFQYFALPFPIYVVLILSNEDILEIPTWNIPVMYVEIIHHQIDGFAQDCSYYIANALALLQSCNKPLQCHQKYTKENKCSHQEVLSHPEPIYKLQ